MYLSNFRKTYFNIFKVTLRTKKMQIYLHLVKIYFFFFKKFSSIIRRFTYANWRHHCPIDLIGSVSYPDLNDRIFSISSQSTCRIYLSFCILPTYLSFYLSSTYISRRFQEICLFVFSDKNNTNLTKLAPLFQLLRFIYLSIYIYLFNYLFIYLEDW